MERLVTAVRAKKTLDLLIDFGIKHQAARFYCEVCFSRIAK